MKNTATPVLPLTLHREEAIPTSPAFYYLTDADGNCVAVRCLLGLVSLTGNRTRMMAIKASLESRSLYGTVWKNGELVGIHPHIDLMTPESS